MSCIKLLVPEVLSQLSAAAFVWCREDITYRLPELDQRGSDEENVDSETSASTESLLEDKPGRMDTEGQY